MPRSRQRTSALIATSAALVALVGVAAAPSEAHAQPSSSYAPPSSAYAPPYGYTRLPPGVEPETPEYWYGWQSLIVHGISASMLAVSPAGDGEAAVITVPFAVTGMVFASPIVHWAHGHLGRGFLSLGLQMGGALVGALTGGGLACAAGACRGSGSGLGFFIGSVIGAPLGATTAFVVDVAVLAWDPRTEQYDAESAIGWRRRPIALVPVLDIRKGRATFGVGGSF